MFVNSRTEDIIFKGAKRLLNPSVNSGPLWVVRYLLLIIRAIAFIQILCLKPGLMPRSSYTPEEDLEGQRKWDAWMNRIP